MTARSAYRLGLALTVTAALAGVSNATAAPGPGPWTVVGTPGNVHGVVAGFDRNRVSPTLGSLIRTWGQPASRRQMPNGGCRAVWKKPRAVVKLFNFRDPGRECQPALGFVQEVTTVGPRWRTWKGLRVGAREDQVRARHPRAMLVRHELYGRAYLLEPTFSPIISGQDSPVVAAVRNGKVTRFHLWIGGAGE